MEISLEFINFVAECQKIENILFLVFPSSRNNLLESVNILHKEFNLGTEYSIRLVENNARFIPPPLPPDSQTKNHYFVDIHSDPIAITVLRERSVRKKEFPDNLFLWSGLFGQFLCVWQVDI